MIRLTELKLPLDHDAAALEAAVLERLGAVRRFSVARRAVDARRKAQIRLTYTIDAEVEDEPGVLTRLDGDGHVVGSGQARELDVGVGE